MTRTSATAGRRPVGSVRAPELVGTGGAPADGWINTGGRPLRLRDLRGRAVLLHFLTSGCINCLHVLDELRPLEHDVADVLTVIGVHSPKFTHEADQDAVGHAMRRLGVTHPVLSDPAMTNWQAYAVRAWPTLVVIDPEGYVVHVAAGEGHEPGLRSVIAPLADRIRAGNDAPPAPAGDTGTGRRDAAYPTKATLLPGGDTLLVSLADRLVSTPAAAPLSVVTELTADVRAPGGHAVLPAEVAAAVGYDVVVADTGHHRLLGLRLDGTRITELATGCNSPWDVAWWQPAGGVVIAMAGDHTLGLFDPATRAVTRLAGTTVEGCLDGPARDAFFAQTSGLAADGPRLWMVDAESSALRLLRRVPGGPGQVGTDEVSTVAGGELFDFGHRDGPAGQALLQHPLGLAVLDDGGIAIADTYNGAVRRYDPATRTVGTLATGLAEPSDVLVAGGRLLVVQTSADLITPIDPPAAGTTAAVPDDGRHQVRRPPTELPAGPVELVVVYQPPPGQRLDDRDGPATRLEVTAAPPGLLRAGAGAGTGLRRRLEIDPGHPGGVLQVVAQAAACDDAAEHPVCRVSRQDWAIPVRVGARRPAATLELMMSGSPGGAGPASPPAG